MPIFDNLEWHDDRLIRNGWVYRLEQRLTTDRPLSADCFRFYKDRGLIDSYEAFFSQRRPFRPQRFVELGIWDGGSVAFWYDVFRPRKQVAIDLERREDSPYFRRFVRALDAESRLRTYWGVDQADSTRLCEIVDAEFDGPLDLVIDDASHLYAPTRASFQTLFPRLAPEGLYIIEDWAWEHWDEFDVPGNAFQNAESPTRLVQELVECAGTRGSPIAGVAVGPGFTVIERSHAPLPPDRPFLLREHVSRRLFCGPRPASPRQMSPGVDLSVFVVSWSGQHDRAVAIADAVMSVGCDVRIVFSDPNLRLVLDTRCPTVRRPDHLFWGDKFTACLERCRADAMLIIHADCVCDDWPGLVRRCREVLATVPQCGAWAPHIEGTPYPADVVTFARLSADGLYAAAQTDAIVLGISKPVLDRLRTARFDGNVYGWGVDQLAVVAAYAGGQLAVIDARARVVHPPSRGYCSEAALAEWKVFLLQLSSSEQQWHESLWEFVAAGVALKARRSGSDFYLGGESVVADGPATTAEIEKRLGLARAGLLERCAKERRIGWPMTLWQASAEQCGP